MKISDKTPFYRKVRKSLEDKDVKMEDFFKAVDISPTHWHFIGKGTRRLRPKYKKRILEFLATKVIILAFLLSSCATEERTFQIGEQYRLAKQMYGFNKGDTVEIIGAANDTLNWRTTIKTIHPSGNSDFDVTMIRRDHEKYLVRVPDPNLFSVAYLSEQSYVLSMPAFREEYWLLSREGNHIARLSPKMDTISINTNPLTLRVIIIGKDTFDVSDNGKIIQHR